MPYNDSMTTLVAERPLTADEFLELPDDPLGRRMELCDGRIAFMSQPGERHADVALRILLALHPFVSMHWLGKVRNDVGFVLRWNPDRVVAPDVGFIASERLPSGRDTVRHFPAAPTLAVEIVSPNDVADTVIAKVREYLAAGSARVWVVDPRRRTVTLYRHDAEPRTLAGNATLTSDDAGFAADGFELTLNAIFASDE